MIRKNAIKPKKGRCERVSQHIKKIQFSSYNSGWYLRSSKRFSSEASVHTCLSFKKKAKASYTLEAAVLIPLFTCFLVAVMFFFRVIEVQENLYEAMQYTGRKLSTTAFAEQYGTGSLSVPLSAAAAEVMVREEYRKNFQEEENAYRYMSLGRAGLSLLGSDTTGDYIDLKASYTMKLPVDIFGIKTMPCREEVKVRKWNGYQTEGADAAEEEEIFVYVTPHGTVYHMDRNCHYLDLSTRSVSKGSIKGLRNRDGACYYPCEICGKKQGAGLCYITDYGTSYHTSLSCSGLKRSIFLMRRSEAEAEGKGPCSKCGG